MGQDAGSTDGGLGLLCKHMARKRSHLGWEKVKSGPDSVFSFASMFVCPEVQQAAAWVQCLTYWCMAFYACFHAHMFYFQQLPMHVCASARSFQRDV